METLLLMTITPQKLAGFWCLLGIGMAVCIAAGTVKRALVGCTTSEQADLKRRFIILGVALTLICGVSGIQQGMIGASLEQGDADLSAVVGLSILMGPLKLLSWGLCFWVIKSTPGIREFFATHFFLLIIASILLVIFLSFLGGLIALGLGMMLFNLGILVCFVLWLIAFFQLKPDGSQNPEWGTPRPPVAETEKPIQWDEPLRPEFPAQPQTEQKTQDERLPDDRNRETVIALVLHGDKGSMEFLPRREESYYVGKHQLYQCSSSWYEADVLQFELTSVNPYAWSITPLESRKSLRVNSFVVSSARILSSDDVISLCPPESSVPFLNLTVEFKSRIKSAEK